MSKTPVSGLGKVGIIYDSDPSDLPLNAMTDALNVRFAGREIEQGLGNAPEPYYTTALDGSFIDNTIYLIQPVLADAYSSGARVLYYLADHYDSTLDLSMKAIFQQNMDIPDFKMLNRFDGVPAGHMWDAYKGQINGCPFFGSSDYNPVGKEFEWTEFGLLPGWGEQTGGDQIVVTRRWSCRNMVSYGNRLVMLNTREENSSGIDVHYPTRIRWSGFTQQNAFPINWDDTALNRIPEEAAAAVIDGYAGWAELSSDYQLVDACDNGGTLFIYTERETFSCTPTGNANSPFNIKQVYSDLGILDIGCVVNAKGYNYVFTGSDFVRHDSVRWESLAEGVCRDWLNDIVTNPTPGAIRLINYPELSEIWITTRGDDQLDYDNSKTQCLTYNYVMNTWSRKTLPYINDAAFVPLAPVSGLGDEAWDDDQQAWDDDDTEWGGNAPKIAQGAMVGACNAGGVYYLNTAFKEHRHVYSGGAWGMVAQDLQCFVERKGIDLADGQRQFITKTELRGRGTDALDVSLAGAESPDAGYRWEKQEITALVDNRRLTWLIEGSVHGYRMEFKGRGTIPNGITIHHEDSGE